MSKKRRDEPMTFEIIVGLFIITNTCLQLYWFKWSKSVEKRKHFTDSDSNNAEIDLINNIDEYLELKVQNEIVIRDRDKEWQEFMSVPKRPGVSIVEIDHSEHTGHPDTANAHLDKDDQGKYDHSKVDGALDGMFSAPEVPEPQRKP